MYGNLRSVKTLKNSLLSRRPVSILHSFSRHCGCFEMEVECARFLQPIAPFLVVVVWPMHIVSKMQRKIEGSTDGFCGPQGKNKQGTLGQKTAVDLVSIEKTNGGFEKEPMIHEKFTSLLLNQSKNRTDW